VEGEEGRGGRGKLHNEADHETFSVPKYYEDKIKKDGEGERDMYGREEKLMENSVWKALRKGIT